MANTHFSNRERSPISNRAAGAIRVASRGEKTAGVFWPHVAESWRWSVYTHDSSLGRALIRAFYEIRKTASAIIYMCGLPSMALHGERDDQRFLCLSVATHHSKRVSRPRVVTSLERPGLPCPHGEKRLRAHVLERTVEGPALRCVSGGHSSLRRMCCNAAKPSKRRGLLRNKPCCRKKKLGPRCSVEDRRQCGTIPLLKR